MDLEEMQAVWSDMSDQLEKQKKLTNEIIIKMTQDQYKKKINKIVYSEFIGGIICAATVIYILVNFHKLDSWLTLTSGITTLIVLIGSVSYSYWWVRRANRINLVENSYKQTLIDFSKFKKKSSQLKKFSYFLGIGMMIIVLPVFLKLMGGKDFLTDPDSVKGVLYALPFGILFMIIYTYFVMKYYGKTIRSAGNLLEDLKLEEDE
ncbi:hypothetical protein GWK08_17265 [Leptobacterium flavescens]|uniref:DUF3278 domain-containing protein n=1 Tax=Leptobacterium flavescens TaxID=472055 RepID=A0A6P0UTP3_9FLAO|nr:hypothetical protein [Leptobacterium flavescens]NER15209.1 hypothetical protein [Leptobacterium flavescens]